MNKREKEVLQHVFDVLENYSGDSDPDLPDDITEDEIVEYFPIFYATRELAKLLYGKDE